MDIRAAVIGLLGVAMIASCQLPAGERSGLAGFGFLGQGMAPASQAGALQVKVQNGLAARKAQAVIGDIDHVVVTVEQAGIAARVQTLGRSQLGDGGASAAALFDMLWPRSVTVSAAAFSSQGEEIGSAQTAADIRSGETTPVTLHITLVPTYIRAGNADVDVTLEDGPEILVPAGTLAPESPIAEVSE